MKQELCQLLQAATFLLSPFLVDSLPTRFEAVNKSALHLENEGHGHFQAAEHAATSHKWSLRVCNAYAFKSGLDVSHTSWSAPSFTGRRPDNEDLTMAGVPYKQCKDLGPVRSLGPGSTLSFRFTSGLHVGAFAVGALPEKGSLLQLVVYRHDADTTAAAFTSHAFADLGDAEDAEVAEVAVIDSYTGASKSDVEVRDETGKRRQSLRYGRAVTLKAGWYEWRLGGDHLAGFHGGSLVGFRLHPGDRCTAIRVGVEAVHGPTYPEELLLFPMGGWTTVHSRAASSRGTYAVAFFIWVSLVLGSG